MGKMNKQYTHSSKKKSTKEMSWVFVTATLKNLKDEDEQEEDASKASWVFVNFVNETVA